jgi:hypothetical protein
MKHSYIFLFALLASGCMRSRFVEITGNLTGIQNGAFRIKEPSGKLKFSGDIVNGKFHMKQLMDSPGYYNLTVIEDETSDKANEVYDIYLEGGSYTIEGEAGKTYPSVKSASKIQGELSDYYTMLDKANGVSEAGVLDGYVSKNPENDIEAHILSKMDYESYPETFYPIYQKFNDLQKNSPDGQDEGAQLAGLIKLTKGAQAPSLTGSTPDGKPFDAKTINKKVILVEFWRPDVEVSRINHKRFINDFFSPLKNKDFTIVSFCLTGKKDEWTNAIKEDGMYWLQVSDLKGDDSPDMKEWAVKEIPTYDLLDGNWHIIKRGIAFEDIPGAVAGYLNVPLN